MPLKRFPPAGTVVIFEYADLKFSARLDNEVIVKGNYKHGKIIKDYKGSWYSNEVNFGPADMNFMSILEPVKVPDNFTIKCKNNKTAEFTVKKL